MSSVYDNAPLSLSDDKEFFTPVEAYELIMREILSFYNKSTIATWYKIGIISY